MNLYGWILRNYALFSGRTMVDECPLGKGDLEGGLMYTALLR
ncbi:hypothetical protein JCM19233_2253 [Vibrio astriarenae]|nr:hypothetical protein JCM19233_2253 [Vibrio sp. C7]